MDTVVNTFFGPYRTGLPLQFFAWFTDIGTGLTGIAVVGAAAALLWSMGRWRVALAWWLCFVGAEATAYALKFTVGRARPDFLPGLSAGSPSFPSAHATVAVAVYGFLALLVAQDAGPWRRLVLAAGAIVVGLIGFSRMFLSLHYLTDVLAGYAVGAAWAWLGWRLARPNLGPPPS